MAALVALHSVTSAAAAPATLWGIDTIDNVQAAGDIPQTRAGLGGPQFVGRYLNFGNQLSGAEAAYIHSQGLSILLLDDANRTFASGSADAQAAVARAQALGVPGGTAIFRDVEVGDPVTAPYIAAYSAVFAGSQYVAGFYENPITGNFSSAFCAAVAANSAIGANVALYSNEPENQGSDPHQSAAPSWNPFVPACANRTVAWQYLERGLFPPGTWPNVDVDEYRVDSVSLLWRPILDGNFVTTPDGAIYRIAGGAPLWISSCAPFGACNPTAVSNLSSFQQYPAEGTTLQVVDGGTGAVLKVVGGAPLWLSTCAAGCGSPIGVNQATIASLGALPGTAPHLAVVPSDGTTVREVDGNAAGAIFKIAGGSPLYMSSCVPGCGGPLSVNQFTIAQLAPEPGSAAHHLNLVPAGGTTLREADGNAAGAVLKVAGGAPLVLYSCAAGCGSPVDVNQSTVAQLGPEPGTAAHHLTFLPGDGTTLREADSGGAILKVAGGAPMVLSTCAAGCGSPVDINQATIANLAPEPGGTTFHLNAVPAGGTTLREADGTTAGAIFKVAGGAPLPLFSCTPGCGSPVDVNQYTIAQLAPEPGTRVHHLRKYPANGTVVEGLPSGAYWVFVARQREQSASSPSAVTVDDNSLSAFVISPTITSLTPASARSGDTVTVAAAGAFFEPGATVSFSGSGLTVSGVTFVDSTSLTLTLVVSPGASVGARNVTITNPDGGVRTAKRAFRVLA